MDIQKIINDAVAKLKADDKLLANFRQNPTKVLEKLVGIDLPDDKVDPIVKGILAALRFDRAEDATAPEVQAALREQGIDAVLERYMGLAPEEPLFSLIREAWARA